MFFVGDQVEFSKIKSDDLKKWSYYISKWNKKGGVILDPAGDEILCRKSFLGFSVILINLLQ